MLLSSALIFILATLPFNVIAEGPKAECYVASLENKSIFLILLGGEWNNDHAALIENQLKPCGPSGASMRHGSDPRKEVKGKVFMGELLNPLRSGHSCLRTAVIRVISQFKECEEADKEEDYYPVIEGYIQKYENKEPGQNLETSENLETKEKGPKEKEETKEKVEPEV